MIEPTLKICILNVISSILIFGIGFFYGRYVYKQKNEHTCHMHTKDRVGLGSSDEY